MILINKMDNDTERKFQNLKKKFPNVKFDLTPNDSWKPFEDNLRGTYTLSYSGGDDDLYDYLENYF